MITASVTKGLTVEDYIWTVKVFCNLLKIWLRVFGNFDMKKSYCVRKKYRWNHAIIIPEYLRIIFDTIILFIQLNVNSINSFNANFKKHGESVANQISNKAKNTNYSLEIEELINLRKLYTNNPIIG